MPRSIERWPCPEGEWEQASEAFVKRTGFPERVPLAKAKAKRIWCSRGFQFAVFVALLSIYQSIRVTLGRHDGRECGRAIAYHSAWVSLGDGIAVRLTSGATLRQRREEMEGRTVVMLEGAARLVVDARDGADGAATPGRFRVRTRPGVVTAAQAEFTVTAVGDTTVVVVHALPSRDWRQRAGSGVSITRATSAGSASSGVTEGQQGRMVRDSVPEIPTKRH